MYSESPTARSVIPGIIHCLRRARHLPVAALAVCLLQSVRPAMAEGYPGFGLNASRVVVSGEATGGTLVTALNNSDSVYLVQSRVWPADGLTGYPLTGDTRSGAGTTPPPFLVTPPLRRMGPQSRLPLRILPTAGVKALPADRESLFFLSVKAIPSVPSSGAPGKGAGHATAPRVILALQQFVKLYYRPAGLKPRAIFDGDVAPKLTMRLDGGKLQVTNPTPYHIAFGHLTVNGRPVAQKALRVLTPPDGTQDYPLPAGAGHAGETVAWQVIDEFGLVTKKQTQTLP